MRLVKVMKKKQTTTTTATMMNVKSRVAMTQRTAIVTMNDLCLSVCLLLVYAVDAWLLVWRHVCG